MTANGSSDPDRTRQDIEKTRAELGATVRALAAKTDVKARGRDRAIEIGGRARQRLTSSAQTMRGKTRNAVRTARQKAGSTGLDGMVRAARQRGAALGAGRSGKSASLRGGVTTGPVAQRGPAAARALRGRLVRIQSAARQRPALVVAVAVTVGVAVTTVRRRRAAARCRL
ncbi:DUF3618 domain-containing protein [Micromonospora sp. URMC 106]|uniref:DUF3618 domain-containing protein n=1 Tax=Micromonospora sp. URMC 106 TaxID=3423408 RepID=UPI003F1BA5FE